MAHNTCASMRGLFSRSFRWLCVVYFLFCWSQRMWAFALGLYLVHMQEGVLRLVAIFGFTSGGSVLLFGGVIGQWVDRNSRLTAVRLGVIIQDVCVAAFSVLVFIILQFETSLGTVWNGALWKICAAAIVVLAIVAQLFGMAVKISLERDWFVVLSHGDTRRLAKMNSLTRCLDMACSMLAPFVLGQIMTYMSLRVAALFMVAYSLVSVVIKYLLLGKAFRLETALARSKTRQALVVVGTQHDSHKQLAHAQLDDHQEEVRTKRTCLQMAVEPFVVLVKGWRVYAKQQVVLAGIALATLYMNIIDFDAITTGYVYANGMTESALGIIKAMTGLTGIIGALLFPVCHRRLGLPVTGLIGYSILILSLSLPVISIWLPGSPWDADFLWRNASSLPAVTTLVGCDSVTLSSVTLGPNVLQSNISDSLSSGVNGTMCADIKGKNAATISIIVFLTGIIVSRIGLWIIDLTVTQLFQENVIEKERGTANGAQNSLNMLFDMTIYIIVIFLPHIETFGILVLFCYCFITCGAFFFFTYACKHKGLVKAGFVKESQVNALDKKIKV